MPRIKLKPNSPEYADPGERQEKRICDMPGCRAHADNKAPKDRGLAEYYHFCKDHVSDYNKAWNFFDGMAASEVEDHVMSAKYGDRPTWRYDSGASMEDDLYNRAWKTYHNTQNEPPRGAEHAVSRNTPEYEAMALMGLEPPLSLKAIKDRYKTLAKKHHPDRNRGCKDSEELLKGINMAYTVLKLAYAKFETLEK